MSLRFFLKFGTDDRTYRILNVLIYYRTIRSIPPLKNLFKSRNAKYGPPSVNTGRVKHVRQQLIYILKETETGKDKTVNL